MQLKMLMTFLVTLVTTHTFSQTSDTVKKKSNTVSFITKVNIANATKDGIYLNGYVVNIDYLQAKKLDGKTIKVTGKVTIVKGLGSLPKEYGKNGEEIIKGGRWEDTKHILSPTIKIIN